MDRGVQTGLVKRLDALLAIEVVVLAVLLVSLIRLLLIELLLYIACMLLLNPIFRRRE